ncbi:hypothetical protein PJE062_3956 [Pseudovibrio sp. JE062]|nr:hypothetical protein PJE062_3956 [Pseudovibrio sp. JE062]
MNGVHFSRGVGKLFLHRVFAFQDAHSRINQLFGSESFGGTSRITAIFSASFSQ